MSHRASRCGPDRLRLLLALVGAAQCSCGLAFYRNAATEGRLDAVSEDGSGPGAAALPTVLEAMGSMESSPRRDSEARFLTLAPRLLQQSTAAQPGQAGVADQKRKGKAGAKGGGPDPNITNTFAMGEPPKSLSSSQISLLGVIGVIAGLFIAAVACS